MSNLVTNSMVESYKDNMYHLTQQKGSRLRRGCRMERVVGRTHYFDQLGPTAARLRTSRHSDTPRMDVPHSRRRVALNDYDWADLIDNEDQIRMLANPTSMYAEAGAMAMGRAMDDAIITAADATAYTGQDGSTTQAYDTNMTIAVNTRWPGVSDANYGLNVAKLLEAGQKLGSGNVDPDEEKYCIVNAAQVKSLLMDTRVSSHDYNAIKPLVNGQISQFAGFTMIPTERIGNDGSGYNKVLYWAKNGLALAIGADITVRINERSDKNYATQVFCAMTIGAARLEEARVGLILCHTTNGPG